MSSTYYNMTDSTGASGFLPTVTFTSTGNTFSATQRSTQLAALGITGFYEADFADNITTINASAFENDNQVVVATINKVQTIGTSAFSGCTALRAITLDCAVDAGGRYLLTSIGTYAFYLCISLRNLHIPDTVKIIPDYLCYGCTKLEVAVMGYGWNRSGDSYVTDSTIGSNAFNNCYNLSYFIVPETVSSIGDSAFANTIALIHVYILGTPTVSSNAFSGARNLSTSIYYYNTTSNISSFFPALATKRAYTEFTLTATGALISDTVKNTIPVTTYWKGKIAASVTSLAQSCFEGSAAGIGAKYPYMVALSLPPALTTIGYGAFLNTDGTSGYNCIVGAFYIPNSVVTLGTINNTSNTFAGLDTTLRDGSTTKQIVFQSGTNTIAFPAFTYRFSSAMAIIAPNVTSFGQECFNQAKNVQLYSFFQKNAYTSTTRLDGLTNDAGADAFTWNFNKGIAGYTHYLYIPKKITRIAAYAFRAVTDKLYVTAYHNSNLTTDTTGLGFGFFSYDPTYNVTTSRFTQTAPTIHLIYNYYDAAGLTLTTSSGIGSNFPLHILYPSGVKTINNRLAGYTGLKSINIPDTVTDINASAFSGCTGLTNVYISPNSNLTVLNNDAFSGCTALTTVFIPNSLRGINTSTFSGCNSLASVTYGTNPSIKYIGNQAFYNVTRALTNIFIPSSVVFIGNSVFIGDAGTNILNTVTFGAGSRLRSIDYRCFGYNGGSAVAAQYLHDLVLPSSLRYMGGLGITAGTTASALQSTHRLTHSANLVVPSSLEVIPWAFLYADSGTVDISNVYFPVTITNVAGPRKHNGYTSTGSLTGAEFWLSKAGSLIYLPSGLSAYAGYTGYAFPNSSGTEAAGRARSFYRTVSFTTNPLITLGLSSGNPTSTTNASTTSQIHADIKDGVTVIGDGTLNITNTAGSGSLNLISVNIPSTVNTISANAFNGCSALAYVTFSENSHLTTIGNSAFSGCTTIHDIQLPDTVTTIGTNAFAGCYNLASISIPYNVTSIGAGAFNININTPTTYIARPQARLAYQLGGDIYGESVSDYSGFSVSISQDGKTLAIGAYLNDATGGDAGHVRVFKYQTIPVTDTTWANYTVGSFSNTGTYPFTKPIVVNGGDALPVSGKSYWVQLGNDIDGEAAGNNTGRSVSLSSDGLTLAIGAPENTGGGTQAGLVRVYKYQTIAATDWTNYTINSFTYVTNKPIVVNGADASPVANKYYWVQLGGDIDGVANSQSGFTVALNSDGTTVVIGAPLADIAANGTAVSDTGSVRIYVYNGSTTWNQRGSTITGGDSVADHIGYSVAISDDGYTIAYGAPHFDTVGSDKGLVRIYKYISNAWTLLGGTHIPGEVAGDYSGESVSLSSDGTIVAIGSIWNDSGGAQSGHVRVYKFNGTSWIKLGQNINGLAGNDEFGNSVSLNGDGTILAVGSRYSDSGSVYDTGLARIYKYIGDAWQQIGQDIRGYYVSEITGCSVSLSKDGTTVALGAYGNDSYGIDNGMVRVYQINQFTVPIRLHQRLYNDISGSLSTYFPGINTSAVQVVPALQLTNTLNPSKLTLSQINNMYIRYRQSQLSCTKVTVSASSGGTLSASDITTALSGTTGLVHLDISSNVTSIAGSACANNIRIYSVAISKTVVSLDTSVFNGCTNLTYLSFHPDSVCTTIGDSAFYRTNIIDLALPDSLTTIVAYAFYQSYSLTSVCIPKNVTSLGSYAFYDCSKLTSVALPVWFATYGTGTYFSTSGTSTSGITFTYYSATSASSAIPHFKLSDYSMPSGIVQTVIDSAVKYIDHRAYAYYPDITLYAVTTNKQTQTPGQYNYTANNVKFPIMPATFWVNGNFSGGSTTNSIFPIYRSAPDLNVYSLDTTAANWLDNTDDFYILMPGYSICIYNNLYDEENLFTDSPIFRYYDNEFGTVPLNITLLSDVINKTSSILIMSNGRILSKYFAS